MNFVNFNSQQIPFENLTREGIIDCYQAYYQKACDSALLMDKLIEEVQKETDLIEKDKIRQKIKIYKDYVQNEFYPFDLNLLIVMYMHLLAKKKN